MTSASPGDSGLSQLRWATLCLPLHPAEPCGDAVGVIPDPATETQLLVMVDGLGHGPQAARAAMQTVDFVTPRATWPLTRLVQELDAELHNTRGAAVGLARIRGGRDGLSLDFAGVGNTRALRWRGRELQHLPSQHGVVGGGLSDPVIEHTLDLMPGDWVLMFSDGLTERLDLPPPLPEWLRDPALLCSHLVQHWRNRADDIGLLVCHVSQPAALA